jgi:membrane-associated phospholipid phosphatase
MSEGARRLPAAVGVLVAYLVLTAPLIPLGGVDARRIAVLGLHLVVLGLLVFLPTRPRPGRAVRLLVDWTPLALAPFLYWELPLLMEAMPGPVQYHDPIIVAAERALFGTQPAYEWAGAMPWLPLSELLHACYLSYYLLIYVPPLLLYLGPRATPGQPAGSSPAFRETVLAVMLAFLGCYVVFIVMPVQGPRYLGVPDGVPAGPVRAFVLDLLEAGSSRGAAFPSSHVSVSIAQALMALRHQPRVGRRILPIAIGLAAGAVYGGFHYGIDALAGGVVGVGAALCAGPLRRRIEGQDAGFTRAPAPV